MHKMLLDLFPKKERDLKQGVMERREIVGFTPLRDCLCLAYEFGLCA